MNKSIIKSIGVFCGSNLGNNSVYANAAREFAEFLAAEKIKLVYGGANVGIMGVLADTMIKQGGEVIGIIPESLVSVEIAHKGLTELHIVNSMHERKALLSEKADAFVMLPGGPGSLDEFFEIFTWGQLGYHKKPFGILNINRYFEVLLTFLKHCCTEGFMKYSNYEMVIVEDNPSTLIEKFKIHSPNHETKWIVHEN